MATTAPITVTVTLDEETKSLLKAIKFVLEEREAELLEIKGPCSNKHCPLHYAHRGPCSSKPDTTYRKLSDNPQA